VLDTASGLYGRLALGLQTGIQVCQDEAYRPDLLIEQGHGWGQFAALDRPFHAGNMAPE